MIILFFHRENETYQNETYQNQCKLFEWGNSIIRRYNCIANITSTIAEDGTVNDTKFHDLYSGTVLEDQMESIKKENKDCAADADTFFSNNEDMIIDSWQNDKDA